VRQNGLDVGGGHRDRVDHGLRPERADPRGERGKLGPVGVQVGAQDGFGFRVAAVHEEHLVATLDEEVDHAPADELGAADDEDPHPPTRSRRGGRREPGSLRADRLLPACFA
jgi:hypothetical protein